MDIVEIRTDAACWHVNKKMGIGVVVFYRGEEIYSHSYNFGLGTVSIGEWAGLLFGLKWIDDNKLFLEDKKVEVFMDSQYVVKTVNGEYNCKAEELKVYFRAALKMLNSFPLNQVSVEWQPRKYNQRADELSKEGLTKRELRSTWWDTLKDGLL